MNDATSRRLGRVGFRALARGMRDAPPQVVLAVGVVVTVLGLLIALRPLTSLALLGVAVGLSAIATGVLDLSTHGERPRWWTRVFALAWIAGGAVVLILLGRSLDALPVAIALLLLVGGLASLGDAIAGTRVSERVLAAAWGAAQLVFGWLSLTWPDVTVLVVAVVFGIRTVVFGASLMLAGARRVFEPASDLPGVPLPTPPRRTPWADIARVALAGVLLAAAAAGWWLNDWLASGAPVVDGFYDPPAAVSVEHGRLIRTGDYTGRVPADAVVERILYTTRDANGEPALGSALVIRPADPPLGFRPVVLWNHGTTGVARACAPSLQSASATRWAVPDVDEALERGWVVVAPDYAGQGTAGVFPYLIGLGEARSGLDAVRAARQMPGLFLSRDVAVWGHSQGGHAALWAAQEAADYTPDLRVVGTVALSSATDPYALARELRADKDNALLSVLISWVLVPYADTYDDVVLRNYVAPGGRTIVREMAQRCPTEPGVVVSVLAALGLSEDRPLYAADLTAGPLGGRLYQNAPTGPWTAPVLLAWGRDDEVIPRDLQREFAEDICADAAFVHWFEFRGYDHTEIMLPGSRLLPTLIEWTDRRFHREVPASTMCEAPEP